MNKYNISRKAREAAKLIIVCIVAGFSLWLTIIMCRHIPRRKPAAEAPRVETPARYSFSSPSSGSASASAGADLYRVSAYCPCEICCGKWADGFTASGKPAKGKLVAAPSDTAFGTVLRIPGYGKAGVWDRGGDIKGNRLDVLFATHEQAKQWGVQWLVVKEIQ